MKSEEIIAAAAPATSSSRAAVSLHLKCGKGAEHALEALSDLLGEDPSISEVDVVIAGEYVGTLGQEALFGFVEDRTMKPGDGSNVVLPGDSKPIYVRLRCPTEECKRCAIFPPDLYSPVPVCADHHCPMVVYESR